MTARDAAGTAYLVVKRRMHRVAWSAGIPFSQILYCSAPDVLVRNLERIKLAIMWQQKTFGIAMNERLFPEAPRAIREKDIAQYRSPVFTANELDLLYSEFVLLDIWASRLPLPRAVMKILRRSWIAFCSWVLRDREQLSVRVGPLEVDAAPQHSTGPAERSDDVRPAPAM
jgi:hypothetical protein